MHDRLGIIDYRIRTLLKGSIAGVIEDAVFKDEVLAVAKGLCTGDTAADKAEVLGIPAEVFAFDIGIIDRAVLGFPKGVFRIEDGVVDFDIAGILEDVPALQLDIGDLKLVGTQKGIQAILHFEVGDLSVAAVPESLCGIGDLEALQPQSVYLPEGFRGIDKAVKKTDIAVVPKRGSIGCCEMAVAALDILAFPDDVFPFELTINGFYMARLFESRLSLADTHALYAQITALVQRPFSVKILINNIGHWLLVIGCQKLSKIIKKNYL